MRLLDPADRRPVHFVGIAGAGMSALAELFARQGVVVTGCDAMLGAATDLRRLGIALHDRHDPAHVAGVRALVVTSAMPRDHPELQLAAARDIPVVRRAEALGDAVSGGTVVAIAGTHGKTTTTVMTTEALTAAGRAPTGIVGGRVDRWDGNLCFGSTELFVVEADEYDRSFLALSPDVAVVTNVEADHLDIYRDLSDIRETFEKFLEPARYVVLCADDAGANTLATPASAEVIRYGLDSADARLRGSVRPHGSESVLSVTLDGEPVGEARLRVPGAHNARNALAAIGAGFALGATLPAMAAGLEEFHGVERRFQRLGSHAGVDVVDDYAHHPTEILATLEAARAAYPGRRIVIAFQPHLYSRTRDFASEFAAALGRADVVYLTEIYPAREKPIGGVSSSLIVEAMIAEQRGVSWRGVREHLAAALAEGVRDGDVVLTVGAGDVTKTGPELLRRLAERA